MLLINICKSNLNKRFIIKYNNYKILYCLLLTRKHFLNISVFLIHLRSILHRWLDDLVSEDPKVTYNVASNKVIVPMSLLSPPYFETGYPE